MKNILLNTKLSLSWLVALIISLCVSIALRNPFYSEVLGGDTKGLGGYLQNYNRIVDWDSLSVIYYYNDYLFSTFAYAMWSLQIHAKIYLFILAFCSTLILFLAYKNIIFSNYKKNIEHLNFSSSLYKRSFYIFLSAIIFVLCSSSFYLFAVNALRQFLAIAIFLYGLSLWFNDKPKLGSVIFLISIFAHTSALFLVGCFYISLIFSFRFLFLCLISIFSFKLFLNSSFNFDYFFLEGEWIKKPGILQELVAYINYKIKVLSAESTGLISLEIKLMHAFCFSFFSIIISVIKNDPIFSRIVKMYFTFVVFCFMISNLEAMTNRFLLYTGLMEPLILAYTIFYVKKSQMISASFLLNTLAIFYLTILLFFHPSIRGELMLIPQPLGSYELHGMPDPELGRFINPTY